MTMPLEPNEHWAATLWPTIAATPAGRVVGRLAATGAGWGPLTVGNLLVIATIPLSLAAFAWLLLPLIARRYVLTTRRIIILRGLARLTEDRAIGLDQFETIDVEVLPGQHWFHAGDLVFRRSQEEVFRLQGVARPQVVRQSCLKVRTALLTVREPETATASL